MGNLKRKQESVDTDGHLVSFKNVRDEEAIESEAIKKSRERASSTESVSLYDKIELAITDSEKKAAVKKWKNFLKKQDPIYKKKNINFGRCISFNLFTANTDTPPKKNDIVSQ